MIISTVRKRGVMTEFVEPAKDRHLVMNLTQAGHSKRAGISVGTVKRLTG